MEDPGGRRRDARRAPRIRGTAADRAGLVQHEVAAPVIAHGRRGALQQHERVEARRVERSGEAQQRRVLAVAPQDVAVDDEEPLAEMRQRVGQPPPPVSSRLSLAREQDIEVAPAAEMIRDHLALVVKIDHRAPHAGRDEPVEGAIDQRAPRHRHQRLRHAVRDQRRSRVPSPAASTIAVSGTPVMGPSGAVARAGFEPIAKRRQVRCRTPRAMRRRTRGICSR